MKEPGVIQGREIGASELGQIRQLLAEHPGWSRKGLSRQLASLWQWRNLAGQLKDMAAGSLLRKLEQRGWVACRPDGGAPRPVACGCGLSWPPDFRSGRPP